MPILNRTPALVRQARLEVRRAIASGLILPAKHCTNCGGSGRIHGHHKDYAHPLVLEWLCVACHHLRHGQQGQGRPRCVRCGLLIYLHLIDADLAEQTNDGMAHRACPSKLRRVA